jgi:predicted N-acetyltransferase YhbS
VVETLTVERSGDCAGISDCIKPAFGREHDFRSALESLEANPLFRPELGVFARSPRGRIVAHCRGTVDPVNGVCGIDRVCTNPDFRQMGLARAVVEACFRTQRDLGGCFCYIGFAPEPAPSTKLYRSLGPSHISVSSTWSRP